MLINTDHNGFPVVISRESQSLIGFVLRRDLTIALGFLNSNLYILVVIYTRMMLLTAILLILVKLN